MVAGSWRIQLCVISGGGREEWVESLDVGAAGTCGCCGWGRWGRVVCCWFFFFFSSRRRHTRFDCDWSSDVCSSDLAQFSHDLILVDEAGNRRRSLARPASNPAARRRSDTREALPELQANLAVRGHVRDRKSVV